MKSSKANVVNDKNGNEDVSYICEMTSKLELDVNGNAVVESEKALEDDLIPCLDAVPPDHLDEMQRLKCCVAKRLHKQCAKSLGGLWINADNVVITQISGGLSNYIFCASLKPHLFSQVKPDQHRKVLIRVYGQVLRNNMHDHILNSVIFTILSEKQLGPKLCGVFPGGRIEEFVESRPLGFKELMSPAVSACIARELARLHKLSMPLAKMPTALMSTLEKFLRQLTVPTDQPRRPSLSFDELGHSHPVLSVHHPMLSRCSSCAFSARCSKSKSNNDDDDNQLLAQLKESVKTFLHEYDLQTEFAWIKQQMTEVFQFPVVFCHNDLQENNILLVLSNSCEFTYKLIPIDLEYCSYNYRGFDIGNHFNEWCYEYTDKAANGFVSHLDRFPSRSEQRHFLRHYFGMGDEVETKNGLISDLADEGLPVDLNSLSDLRLFRGIDREEMEVDFDEEIYREIIYGALLSHLFWAAWSLVQSYISSIEFSFQEYARARMQMYKILKSTLVGTNN